MIHLQKDGSDFQIRQSSYFNWKPSQFKLDLSKVNGKAICRDIGRSIIYESTSACVCLKSTRVVILTDIMVMLKTVWVFIPKISNYHLIDNKNIQSFR